MRLNELKPPRGSKPKKKRVGRGERGVQSRRKSASDEVKLQDRGRPAVEDTKDRAPGPAAASLPGSRGAKCGLCVDCPSGDLQTSQG